ncbi:hypothetical protein V4F39_26890 [Aquincola sp. MAHUQ-54]|uniref:Uncharacterized protein n=1 Tax=Aquincola agrisoli TaxID=3119538 RepID=A0AAW9QEQ6_9BURK
MQLPASLARRGGALALCALAATAVPAADDHGHDHGDAPAPAAAALPRFTAESELFELVGVLDGRRLTLYLDRPDDNSPVTGARLELDIGGTAVAADPHGDGEFEALLAAAPPPGVLPVTVTVVAGDEADLLAGELDIHAPAPADEAPPAGGWRGAAGGAIAGLAAAGALLWAARRRAHRSLRAGGAA